MANSPSTRKVDEKTEELKANVEAAQRQAVLDGSDDPTVERPRTASHELPDHDTVNVLGGYPVPPGAEADATVDNDRVFYDSPGGPDAKKVSLKAGVTDSDVWEAVYQNNAKLPTWVLVAAKGTVVDPATAPHPGTVRMADF